MIDTAEKRRNAAAVLPVFAPGVTPNTSKDSEWRAQAGWGYSGLATGGGGVVAVVHQPMFLLTPGRLMN